jgi:hypothetical protein
MFVELYVHLDEIKCLWIWKDKDSSIDPLSWHAYGEYMVLNPILLGRVWFIAGSAYSSRASGFI